LNACGGVIIEKIFKKLAAARALSSLLLCGELKMGILYPVCGSNLLKSDIH
jgi:hypothetical protein